MSSSLSSALRPVLTLALILFSGVSAAYGEHLNLLTCPEATGREATIVLPTEEALTLPTTAGWLVVSTATNACVGKTPWRSGLRTLTIHGDDPLTEEIDGAQEGQSLQFRLFDENGLPITALFSVTLDASACHGCQKTLSYVHDGVYAVEEMRAGLSTDVDAAAAAGLPRIGVPFPSPASTTAAVDVYLPEAQHLRAVVYNMLGREVYRAHDGLLPPGASRLTLRTAHLANGSYLLRLSSDRIAETRSLTVIR